jgi:hypothetical protein
MGPGIDRGQWMNSGEMQIEYGIKLVIILKKKKKDTLLLSQEFDKLFMLKVWGGGCLFFVSPQPCTRV